MDFIVLFGWMLGSTGITVLLALAVLWIDDRRQTREDQALVDAFVRSALGVQGGRG